MDQGVEDYIEQIAPEFRALFDRIERLVSEAAPEAELVLSYKMPTFRIGKRRLFVAAWKHGLSIYGWDEGRDGGFLDRHPEFKTSKGTIQLRPASAATIDDAELRALIRSALSD
jgi:uncharacterized protein YdhG (YjbR/CyaY superfamily)